MISNIIEESYRRKYKPKTKIKFNSPIAKEPFRRIEVERLNHATGINWKVRRKAKYINDRIDGLLLYSFIEEDEEENKNQRKPHIKSRQISTPQTSSFQKKLKKNKYLFKGDMTIADKINKTKIKEFYLSNSPKRKIKAKSIANIMKEYRNKNLSREITKNMTSNYIFPLSAKIPNTDLKYNSISNDDCFFITKLPNYYTYKSSSVKSKESKLKKMRKIIKETNSHMLDIYTGLKNMKQNKFTTYDNPLHVDRTKYTKGFRNIDRLQLGMQKNLSVSYIKRRFKKLFQNIFENKKFSNEKLDARTILDPLEKITGGGYKEVKLDNNINNKIGQRIWIKKSTANIVSYGKSFQKISDDIFYKERRRIIGIYPKIEKEADLFIPHRKIEKRNPLINKIKDNIEKINNVFLCEYKLLSRINNKYSI